MAELTGRHPTELIGVFLLLGIVKKNAILIIDVARALARARGRSPQAGGREARRQNHQACAKKARPHKPALSVTNTERGAPTISVWLSPEKPKPLVPMVEIYFTSNRLVALTCTSTGLARPASKR